MVRATGENLVLRFGERAGAPPMITIKRFTVQARFIGFFRYPRRIRHLRLEGLQIQIPPRAERKETSSGRDGDSFENAIHSRGSNC